VKLEIKLRVEVWPNSWQSTRHTLLTFTFQIQIAWQLLFLLWGVPYLALKSGYMYTRLQVCISWSCGWLCNYFIVSFVKPFQLIEWQTLEKVFKSTWTLSSFLSIDCFVIDKMLQIYTSVWNPFEWHLTYHSDHSNHIENCTIC